MAAKKPTKVINPTLAQRNEQYDVYVAPKIVAPPTPFIQTTIPKGRGGTVYEPVGQQQTTPRINTPPSIRSPYTGLAASATRPPTSPGINLPSFPPTGPIPDLTVSNAPETPVVNPSDLGRRGGIQQPTSLWSSWLDRMGQVGGTPTQAATGRGIDINALVPTRGGGANLIGASNTPIMNVARLPVTPSPAPRLSRAQETESDKLLRTPQQSAASSRLSGQAAQYPKAKTAAQTAAELFAAGAKKAPPNVDAQGRMSQGFLLQAARLTAAAMFKYNTLPGKMTLRMAMELPFWKKGYASAEEFLQGLGYYFDKVSGWWVLGSESGQPPPTGETTEDTDTPGGGGDSGDGGGRGGYGDGGWDDGGYGRVFQPSQSISRGSNAFGAAGGSLVNWRIG